MFSPAASAAQHGLVNGTTCVGKHTGDADRVIWAAVIEAVHKMNGYKDLQLDSKDFKQLRILCFRQLLHPRAGGLRRPLTRVGNRHHA